MKTRKIEFNWKLTVPGWWPYAHQWKGLWKTILYKIKPDRCHVCKVRLDYKGNEFEGQACNKRIMVSQYAKQPICPHCFAEKIKQYYAQAMLAVKKCDCCGQTKRVTGGIPDFNETFNLSEHEYEHNKAVAKKLDLDVRYGMAWWNGFDLCGDCVVEALNNSHAKTSSYVHWHGHVFGVNHRGAYISHKGKSL